MPRPGIAPKGTNPYLKRNRGGGMFSPSGGGEAGNFKVGSKISSPGEVPYQYSGDPSTQVGKYAFQGGQISEQPVLDDRGFLGRIFGHNTALDINQKLALEKVAREQLLPAILEEEKGKQGVITEAVLERLQGEQKLKDPYLSVVNNFNEPGEVPFQYAGDPSALLADRTNQPYVPINPASVQGNLVQQTALANAKAEADRVGVQKSQLEAEEAKLNQPRYVLENGLMFQFPPKGGEPVLYGSATAGTPGHIQPAQVDPKTGKLISMEQYIPPTAPRFERAPRPKGNIYGTPSVNTTPAVGPMREGYGYGPASTQVNEFPIESSNGMLRKETGPVGGAPTTQRTIGTPRFEGGKLVAPLENRPVPLTPEQKESKRKSELEDALRKLRELLQPQLQSY